MSEYFFFLRPVNKILIGSFWWVLLMLIVLFIPFLRVWWWVFFPFFLSIELRILYLWWIRWDFAYANIKWAVLEIVPPKEVLVPLKAMEDVFANMWGPLYAPPNWREQWCEGDLPDASNWMSWEIVSIEGNLHFYIRVPQAYKLTLETALYGHYPELEIHEVSDYTKNVPQNIPNQEWDVYGEDFIFQRADPYPIKTYEKFFEPQGEKISAEEKRIDPVASLLEMMSKLGPGEQFWLQFTTSAVSPKEEPRFKKEADDIIAKLTNRPIKHTKSLVEELMEMLYHLVMGPKKEGSGEKATYKWLQSSKSEEGEDREMVLTPGEREILTEVENKLKKPYFRTNIRGVYVALRENYSSAHRILSRSYFAHFHSNNLNSLRFSPVTRPKTHYFFRTAIPYIRTRRQFRNYVLRFPPLFPDRRRECPIINTEEMATLYHFPIKITGLVAPTMTRVESKKGGPPPNLPME